LSSCVERLRQSRSADAPSGFRADYPGLGLGSQDGAERTRGAGSFRADPCWDYPQDRRVGCAVSLRDPVPREQPPQSRRARPASSAPTRTIVPRRSPTLRTQPQGR
jgi:hypothetical protein